MSIRERNPRPPRLPSTDESPTYTGWWPALEPDHTAAIARLDPIGLDQIASVALMDRTETKFVFHERQLDAILASLAGSYQILEVSDNRLNHYRTLYFDTPGFALYRRHHAAGRNRYKVRSRSYVDSNLSFLEVKHKVNKNRTVKNRLRTPDLLDQLSPGATKFLAAYYPGCSSDLEPKLWNEYTRITLVGMDEPERVTLDLTLQFRGGGQTIILPGIVVAEVKKNGRDSASAFIELMKALGIRRTGFSKYCMGVAMLYPEIKHNRFKPELRMVRELIQSEDYYV